MILLAVRSHCRFPPPCRRRAGSPWIGPGSSAGCRRPVPGLPDARMRIAALSASTGTCPPGALLCDAEPGNGHGTGIPQGDLEPEPPPRPAHRRHVEERSHRERLRRAQTAARNPKVFRSGLTAKMTLMAIEMIRTIQRGHIPDKPPDVLGKTNLVRTVFGMAAQKTEAAPELSRHGAMHQSRSSSFGIRDGYSGTAIPSTRQSLPRHRTGGPGAIRTFPRASACASVPDRSE